MDKCILTWHSTCQVLCLQTDEEALIFAYDTLRNWHIYMIVEKWRTYLVL